MLKTVNQSWGVSEKFRNRYGSTWADMDFFFKDRVYAETFKTDPMNTDVGKLQLSGMSIPFKFKDVISHSKLLSRMVNLSYKADLSEKFEVDIKNKTFLLNRQEINRLRETIDDAVVTVQRSYELGIYL